jgi:hypothetical protein
MHTSINSLDRTCFPFLFPIFENKLFLFLVWRAELGLEVRDYTLSQSISLFFVIGVFEIGSYKLFPQP